MTPVVDIDDSAESADWLKLVAWERMTNRELEQAIRRDLLPRLSPERIWKLPIWRVIKNRKPARRLIGLPR